MRPQNRRRFLQIGLALAGFGLISGCGLIPLPGQQRTKVIRIGIPLTNTTTDPIVVQQIAGLRQGLSELGYVEGQNFALEFRAAEGRPERITDVVAELVGLPVDFIVGQSAAIIAAARRATTTIPIVFAGTPDPVGQGLVASLAHPGGNLTGLASTAAEFGGKQLELFNEAFPGASRIAMLLNPMNPGAVLGLGEMKVAGQKLRLETQPFEVRIAEDFAGAFAAAKGWHADALMVINDPLITVHLSKILDFATQNRLPAVYTFKEYAVAGGLMAYSASISDLFRRAATYIHKMVNGAKPGDLPVEQPTTFDFVINLKTAEALRVTLPPSILAQATEIIQ